MQKFIPEWEIALDWLILQTDQLSCCAFSNVVACIYIINYMCPKQARAQIIL